MATRRSGFLRAQVIVKALARRRGGASTLRAPGCPTWIMVVLVAWRTASRFRKSGHEREKQERREEHEMDGSLHHVSATAAEGDGADDEGHRQQDEILRFQP